MKKGDYFIHNDGRLLRVKTYPSSKGDFNAIDENGNIFKCNVLFDIARKISASDFPFSAIQSIIHF